MKLMWVCHIFPGIIQERLNGSGNGALWVEHVLSDIRQREEITLRVLAPGPEASGRIDEHLSYSLFPEPKMYVYQPGLEERFVKELEQFQPEVIHIWGAECAHSLAVEVEVRHRYPVDRVFTPQHLSVFDNEPV